jgi:hypothetical protein
VVRDLAYHKTIKFIACHLRNTNATGTEVVQLTDNSLAQVWFINSILERVTDHPAYSILRTTAAWTATAYFYNCTVVGGGLRGLHVNLGTITVKNCAVFNNAGTADILVLVGATVDYNASDVSVGTNWVDISPGASEPDGWNAAVIDYAAGDYRLKDTNSVLYHAGLSQASDPRVPSQDIAGNARPTGSNPVSIGAFEFDSAANLIGHWAFDEGTGQTASDSSGTGNNGTLGTTSGVEASDPTWVCVTGGNALDFDGTDDLVTAPDYDVLNAITISAWVYADTLSTSDGIISKRTGTEVAGNWALRVDNTTADHLEWMVWSGVDSSTSQLSSVGSITTGAWIHVAVTFDDATNTTRFYFNGTPDLFGTNVTYPLANNAQPIAIGWSGQGSQNFDGRIDDVRIYSRVLSPAEISALAASPPTDCAANSPPTLTVDEPDGTGDTVTVGQSYNISTTWQIPAMSSRLHSLRHRRQRRTARRSAARVRAARRAPTSPVPGIPRA